ncbi:AraC family transcriptional regulator [Agrilactobacillus composti DSM 18527 = JCM 14202]|uniref:AraC family transcriptional regulator n=1 Tax=Agrilactobacillus composti DSM 18527 = JCM 14202 TaxID=1423734 RepID=X0PGL7_9LACO|nr:AraC family transcriptional regulator [Agrilactobacillus composti]KRM34639.1 AraC family transcriptional regulator [Agrilactobacillus composti DSM 18527 = JCM 14202]GAF41194.1 transcriptional regulator, AraC family [Agrilactobacillus composti DSM 18527 = JCM 14202]
MDHYSFPLSEPFLFYKGGEFSTDIPWQHNPMYRHGDYEIIICLKGTMHLHIEAENIILNSGDILLVPPFMHFGGTQLSKQPVDFFWLHFFARKTPTVLSKSQFETEIITPLRTTTGPKVITHKVIIPLQFKAQSIEKLLILVRQILDYNDTPSYVAQEPDYLITALLLELSNQFIYSIMGVRAPEKMGRVKEWIRAHMSEDITVKDVAEAMELNPDYLTRVFKREVGLTVAQYIMKLKLETAKALLLHSNLTIKQIAGFSYFMDDKNFMRQFKHHTGLTPSAYRNAYTHVHLNNPQIDPKIPIPKQLEDALDKDDQWH